MLTADRITQTQTPQMSCLLQTGSLKPKLKPKQMRTAERITQTQTQTDGMLTADRITQTQTDVILTADRITQTQTQTPQMS